MELPAAAGVPEIVQLLSVNPAGSVPELRLHVYGAIAQLAVIGWLYGAQRLASGSVGGKTMIGQFLMQIL
jgi:hypothetical protein